jgi:2-iminobutanoate/2-iminopropanoate deaminase
MRTNIVNTTKAPTAVGTYSQGVEHAGVVYFSGQIGLNPEDGRLREGFKAQLEQILANVDALLEERKLTRDHIIKTSIFVTDLDNFGDVNIAYESYFKAPYPARSTIQVPALPKGADVEIEVTAAR